MKKKKEEKIEERTDIETEDEKPIIPQMFQCENCGNLFKDKWETCPACGGKIKEKATAEIEIKTDNSDFTPYVQPTGKGQIVENLPSIDDIFGETRIPTQPSPDDRSIRETKIREAPLDTVFSFEQPKQKVKKIKKVKKVKSAQLSPSFCPYCGKKLPPPVSGVWTFCLYCGMKLN